MSDDEPEVTAKELAGIMARRPPSEELKRLFETTDSERFHELATWLVTGPVAACGTCALEFAIGIVENEAGRPVEARTVCPRPDRRGKTCRERLSPFWSERPLRERGTT